MLAIQGGPQAVTEKLPIWPRIGELELAAVASVLNRSAQNVNELISPLGGGIVAEFESRIRDFFGVPFVISTNSGFAALHIAIIASGVEAGDEVRKTALGGRPWYEGYVTDRPPFGQKEST